MDGKFSCVIRVHFDTEKEAENARRSLATEAKFKKRSEAGIARDGSALIITIHAGDVSALRATANSYLRLLKVLLSVINVSKKKEQ
ncbi:MAG: KEOPS complex subunit Pcc1, partial [Candidatus Micrarchaeota archaeon]